MNALAQHVVEWMFGIFNYFSASLFKLGQGEKPKLISDSLQMLLCLFEGKLI